MDDRPLAIDLFTGLHGWSEGLVAEGFRVIGFDIEDMCGQFSQPRPEHVRLVIQDVLSIHGSQFRKASLIVASPPCQFFSYTAMPWSRAKALAAEVRADPERLEKELALFNACFRIQREACAAAGRRIPLVVENVRGAIPWVGRSRWAFGSFHLWGDVPALMPVTINGHKGAGPSWDAEKGCGAHGMKRWTNPAEGFKTQGMNWSDPTKRGQDFTRIAGRHAGVKMKDSDGYERTHPKAFGWKSPRTSSSATTKRKAASAMIAKIPLALSRHIAATYLPNAPQAQQQAG